MCQCDSVFVSDERNETYFHFWKLQSTCIEEKKKPKAVMHSRTYFLAFIFIEYEHVCTRILNCILPRAVYHFKSYCLRMTRSKKFLADVSL